MPSKILEAVYLGKHEDLTALLASGPTLTIFEAAAVGDVHQVRQLIDADRAVLGQRSEDGWTTLHLAAHFGRVEVVNLLLARGADVHARSENDMGNCALHADATQNGGFTALHEAAFKNDFALAELLLAHGANPALRTNEGETAEAIATRHGHAQLARRLRGERP